MRGFQLRLLAFKTRAGNAPEGRWKFDNLIKTLNMDISYFIETARGIFQKAEDITDSDGKEAKKMIKKGRKVSVHIDISLLMQYHS